MDGSILTQQLNDIYVTDGIKVVIAGVHSRLAPCIAQYPNRITCDCYNCLNNWPNKWKFKDLHPEVQAVMTVSFQDFSNNSNQELYNLQACDPHFFLKHMPTVDSSKFDLDIGKSWLYEELSYSLYHLNYLKKGCNGLINFFEQDLIDVMEPIITRCHCEYDNIRDLTMKYGDMSMQRKYSSDGTKTLYFNNCTFPGLESANIRTRDDLNHTTGILNLSADESDWALLLKFYALTFLRI